jgi:PEP-CTERM/exosortase A-associated glycosyltransferase
VFRRADAVTTICEGLRADIVGRGIPAGKITVIPNAVDLEHFPYAVPADPALRDRLGLGAGPVLGFIGSFYAYEGLDVLVDALPALCAHDPTLRVLLVGGGNEAKALKARCDRLGVSERVRFVGRVPHAEVAAYYSLVDLFVYPRKSMRLTELVTPLKPLEAMAQGKLVAASAVGGHRELIADGITGTLFAPDDPADCAASLSQLLARRGEWEAMRAAARAHVSQRHDWARNARRYRDIYQALLGRPDDTRLCAAA